MKIRQVRHQWRRTGLYSKYIWISWKNRPLVHSTLPDI